MIMFNLLKIGILQIKFIPH